MTTVTNPSVEAAVVEALVDLGRDRELIVPDATFESLEIDSLDLVELGQALEDEFGIQITGEDARELRTVRDAIDLVSGRIA